MTDHLDVVAFGEPLVRLSPPSHARIEQVNALDVCIGGSEFNTAIAASSLGLRARFVTRLTSNPLGRLIRNKAREQGVDAHILWTDDDRVGTYYVEFGASPRANAVTYDRAGSAMSCIRAGEVQWTDALANARIFHTSGITPALSESSAAATLEAVQAAHKAGVVVSIDLNYRARLWSEDKARSVMTEILRDADILLTTEEDTLRVFGIEEPSYDQVAKRLAQTFHLKAVGITLRQTPSVWRNMWSAIAYESSTDTVHRAPTFEIEVVDRVGSGDSFAGGFLFGYLQDGIETGVRYGVGISALKQTIPGDVVFTTRDEVERVLQGGGLRIVR
jgi:2-dehydro-3-deoxygluconokinase